MQIQSHHDLLVWQKSMELVLSVYKASQHFPREEIYGLTAQLRRAVVSVPANIAEGNARATTRDYAHFLSIARGSLMESETLVLLATRLDYTSQESSTQLLQLMDEISRMLNAIRNRLLGNIRS